MQEVRDLRVLRPGVHDTVSFACFCKCCRRAKADGATCSDDEHRYICKWVPTLMLVDLYQRRDKEEIAKLLGDGVAPEPPVGLPSTEEQLKRLRESGEMTEAEIEEVLKMQRESVANAAKADDPIPGVTNVQKAMEMLMLDPSSST